MLSCNDKTEQFSSTFFQIVVRILYPVRIYRRYRLGYRNFLKWIFLSWRYSPLVGLGLLLIHEDCCGF